MVRRFLLALIRGYQFILSPWIGGSCRFWPTCSDYAREAIESHGAWRGSWMMVTRIARCHPYSAGGVDPVPLQFRWRCWCGSAGAHDEPGLSAPKADPRA